MMAWGPHREPESLSCRVPLRLGIMDIQRV